MARDGWVMDRFRPSRRVHGGQIQDAARSCDEPGGALRESENSSPMFLTGTADPRGVGIAAAMAWIAGATDDALSASSHLIGREIDERALTDAIFLALSHTAAPGRVAVNLAKPQTMKRKSIHSGLSLLAATAALLGAGLSIQAAESKPLPPRLGNRQRNPTSSSSWEMTSVGLISAPTIRASCPGRRQTSTSLPQRACALPTTTLRQAALRAGPISSPASCPFVRV